MRILIKQNLYEAAYNELNAPRFSELIENKTIHEIEKMYYLGIVISNTSLESQKSGLNYFEEAYEAIKEKSIMELTWKILYALAGSYMGRGLFKKSADYIYLCKSLIDHIILNIKDMRLRNSYIADVERKAAIEQLELWQNSVK